MIRNYLLTAWRNLQKNRFNAIINVTGLAVAFTCCMLLSLLVRWEFSYNNFQQNRDQLYMVYQLMRDKDGEHRGQSQSYPVAPTMKAEVYGVIRATAFLEVDNGIRYKGKTLEQDIQLVDNDFFRMFSFPIVAGNVQAPLGGLGDVVLSQSTATALFGKEDPVGKPVSIRVSGQWKELRVSAVIADAPENSTIKYKILARTELFAGYTDQKNNWNWENHAVFVQLSPGTTRQQAEAGMRAMVHKYTPVNADLAKKRGQVADEHGDYGSRRLLPFGELHFAGDGIAMGDSVNKTYLYTLALIAVVVMVIACFNFINLNVARSFTRAKEVGIRKTIGAGRRQIYFQLWAESALLFLVALGAAIVLASLVLPLFNQLFREKLQLRVLLQPAVLACTVGGTLLISFLAGGYPAWMVSRFQTVEVLKGKVSVRQSGLLRSGLITFQFVLASALISATLVIYRQFDHLRSAPLGFDQESVISIPVKHAEKTAMYSDALRQELASQPQVLSVTASSTNIGIGKDGGQSWQNFGFMYKDKVIMTSVATVDYDFFRVLGIRPIAGRDFSRDYAGDTAATENHVIITESMARQFGVKNVVGLSFYNDSSQPKWTIVGVVPDFHFFTMNEPLSPMTFSVNRRAGLGYVFVKVRTDNPRAAMELVRTSFHRLEPDNETAASFLTENTARWYAKEERLSSIFFASAAVAILLCCLGLFAIVSLVTEQRRKEIGVRKVLGATIPSITGLLSRSFVWMVVLAFVISTPIAYHFLNQWLENFIYRVNASWWVFALAGVLTLLIALVTVGVQTVRAAMANPVRSLRSE